MLTKTVFCGFGGQGVLLMGHCLANAAMDEDFFTTYLPSYGAEVRGGTANCTVALSDEPIASPVASEPDYLVVMNNPSLLRFQGLVVGGGMMFLNSDMVDVATYRQDVTVVRVPAVKLATDAGNPRGANVAMIGAFLRRAPLVKRETMEAVIRRVFAEKNEKLAEANVVTLRAGHDWVAEGEAHGS